MKHFLFFILIASLTYTGHAQTDDIYFNPANETATQNQWKAIPKGTSQLLVKTGQSKQSNYKTIINLLLDAGFTIQSRDDEFFTISTNYKPLPKTGSYQLNFRCKNNQVVVSGLFTSGISIELYGVRAENTAFTIEKRGSKNSLMGLSFTEMLNFTKKLGEISYQ